MMRRFWMLAVIITCAVECVAGDGREDLSALQSELDQFQGARRAVENNSGGSQGDKLRKLFADETIKRLYNKYPAFPSATWESYVADLEKELKSVERKYKMPRYSPGADESMIEILGPTLAQLKKEYEGLGKKDAKRKELKKKIDDLQTQLENHRSQAKAEKEKWENKSAKIVAERDAALTKIAEKVNGELDAFAELHYQIPIKKLKEREEQAQKLQVAKEKATWEAKRKQAEAEQEGIRRLAEKQKLAAWEERRRKLEPQYRKMKAWYQKQLEYNALTESWFSYKKNDTSGDSYYLELDPPDLSDVQISLENMQYLKWPKSMPKGFAEELLAARITIFKYEDPDAGVRSAFWNGGRKDDRQDDGQDKAFDDFFKDDTPLRGQNDVENRQAKIRKQFLENELKGLSPEEREKFKNAKSADEIREARLKAVEEAQNKAHRKGVEKDKR